MISSPRIFAALREIAYLSVRFRGRLTGAVYLAYFVLAVGAQTLVGHVASGVSTGANVVATLCYAVLVVLLYGLFLPESPTRSGIAALVGIAGCVVTILALFNALPRQVSPLLFFGPYCAIIGYLIVASGFVPRAIGLLLVLAGMGWVAFAAGLLPAPATKAVEALGILAEAALMIWLLAAGIDMTRWNALVEVANDDAPSSGEPA